MNLPALFLTRKQHDAVLVANQRLLQRAFAEAVRKRWCLAGVTFYGLDESTVSALNVILAHAK